MVAGGHAILYRRDARTSIAWVGLIWLVPLLGSLLYFAFGINRVARRARSIRPTHHYLETGGRLGPEGVSALLGTPHLEPMVRLMDRVVELPLLGGNRVELLEGGDRAFAAMLDAIAGARRTVTLTSFIFDSDRAGRRFVDVLGAAVARGVDARVIVDGELPRGRGEGARPTASAPDPRRPRARGGAGRGRAPARLPRRLVLRHR